MGEAFMREISILEYYYGAAHGSVAKAQFGFARELFYCGQVVEALWRMRIAHSYYEVHHGSGYHVTASAKEAIDYWSSAGNSDISARPAEHDASSVGNEGVSA